MNRNARSPGALVLRSFLPVLLSLFLAPCCPGVAAAAVADCDRNGQVTLGEVQTALDAFFGDRDLDPCGAVDADSSGEVGLGEVQASLDGFFDAPAAALSEDSQRDVHVRAGGTHMLVRYSRNGAVLGRYLGFGRISDIDAYDEATVLVAEEDRNVISAVSLHGHLSWQLPVRAPSCVQVLAEDRILVCQGGTNRVIEIDRRGKVLWSIGRPLVDISGAVRLADGNTAVVERSKSAVHVVSPRGAVLWTGTQHLAHPKGLALLPTGELVTSGFDTGEIAFFRPYSDEVRATRFCCHAGNPAATDQGDLLVASPERQVVAMLSRSGVLQTFSTTYRPSDVEMLADGSLLVAEFREPDLACLNARRSAFRSWGGASPPLRSLLFGALLGTLITVLVRWNVLSGLFRRPSDGVLSGDTPGEPHRWPDVSTRRRIEVGAYVLATVGIALTAAVVHYGILENPTRGYGHYAALVAIGGAFLALLQHRLPGDGNAWPRRMERLRRMDTPSTRMKLLWVGAAALVVVVCEGVYHQRGPWVAGTWSAALALLVGGSLQPPLGMAGMRVRRLVLPALLLLSALAARAYRLEEYPANLHLDMAQWTEQALKLIDGEESRLFKNGWAEVPLVGYLWAGLLTAVGGRSLAAARFVSVTGSLVAILATYFLVRRMWGRAAALLSVLFLGVDQVFLHFSRIQAYMDPIPFQVLALLGLVAGMESGRYAWFGIAGILGGYSALTYHAGRLTPPLLILFTLLICVRHRGALAARWRGLLVGAVALVAVLGPQVVVYSTGRADPFGRRDQFQWVRGGEVDHGRLRQMITEGLPQLIGGFWYVEDRTTQYGGATAFFPPFAALLGMAVVATLLRLRDVRGVWLLIWCLAVLFVGGALTRDPPRWTRVASAMIPATAAAATAAAWLYRGAVVAGRSTGAVLLGMALMALVGANAWHQLDSYRHYVTGRRPGASRPSRSTQWVQSLMGRDLQRWGPGSMIYIVAANPIEHSCGHPTMRYYAYGADVQDARNIADYLPFSPTRRTVAYFVDERRGSVSLVKRSHPDARVDEFHDNLGKNVFTRVVVEPAAGP